MSGGSHGNCTQGGLDDYIRSTLERMNRTTVFTDGAAKGNPGPGGWGAIIVTPDEMVTELGGGSPHTTNNKMELSGAIAALETIANASGPVRIYTDSTYLIQGITQCVWG